MVTGTLSYNIYQKDRNDGTLQAEMTGRYYKWLVSFQVRRDHICTAGILENKWG